jgi:hypothetical protein
MPWLEVEGVRAKVARKQFPENINVRIYNTHTYTCINIKKTLSVERRKERMGRAGQGRAGRE